MEKERIQEGLLFRKLPRKGCELFAEEGYHFYDTQNSGNYDENGNLLSEEERSWCTYMTCLCETKEQVNDHIVCVERRRNDEAV